MSSSSIRDIKAVRITESLLSCGSTSRLPNILELVPIWNDESGVYNMGDLDGLLINPAPRFTDLALMMLLKIGWKNGIRDLITNKSEQF